MDSHGGHDFSITEVHNQHPHRRCQRQSAFTICACKIAIKQPKIISCWPLEKRCIPYIGILPYKLMGYQGAFAITYWHEIFHEPDCILHIIIVMTYIRSNFEKIAVKIRFQIIYTPIGSKFRVGLYPDPPYSKCLPLCSDRTAIALK